MSWTLPDKCAFVTGGSRGIGFSIARELISRGANVVIAARDADRLARARAELETVGPGRCVGVCVVDISDRSAVDTATADARRMLGAIDVVVNNAGITSMGEVLDLDAAEIEQLLAVNYLGPVWVTRALAPHLREQGSGRLAFVSSLAASIPIFGLGGYGPTKAALDSFAETIRQELAPHGVKVTVVNPPDVDTDMLAYENKIKPPETAHLSGTVKPLSPDRVASVTVDAIERGKPREWCNLESRVVATASRTLPPVSRRVIDAVIRRTPR